jgi:hypothetical protein
MIPGEQLEISDEMHDQKRDEKQASKAHNELLAKGGCEKFTSPTHNFGSYRQRLLVA